jgi:hypothetical protein
MIKTNTRCQVCFHHFPQGSYLPNVLANFIYQNYRQALDRILKDEQLYTRSCEELRVTPEMCEDFLEQEKAYFQTPTEVPEHEQQDLDYVELLEKLWTAE